MNYREKGNLFCEEINELLKKINKHTAFVTGGGFAYNSIKYNNSEKKGDYDFMIVYENKEDVKSIIEELLKSNFKFEKKYLSLDNELLENDEVDIIRLSGSYLETKSTINLVPISLIKKLSNLENNIVIRKIAHNRNTGLFFAYGSDNDRIIINFLSPSFVTKDGEDHYIHLDFSNIVNNGNIYFGILSDAILKGFNDNYDTIGFKKERCKMLKNINEFFAINEIDNSLYLNLYANNRYFPDGLKKHLQDEFDSYGINKYSIVQKQSSNIPIIVTSKKVSKYPMNSFNFVKNKPLKGRFIDYIELMQNSEYDRQYLIDSLAKFFGYILFNNDKSNLTLKGKHIVPNLVVYGNNDLYMDNIDKYSIDSILEQFINDLVIYKDKLNSILYKNYLLMILNFISFYKKESIYKVAKDFSINLDELLRQPLKEKITADVLNKVNDFESIGMYHNYTSSVMPTYTKVECDFLEQLFSQKDKPVLDVMCGYGRIANELANRNYTNLYGIDMNDYKFLNIDKDFRFIKENIFSFNSDIMFKYLYSFYNCYSNKNELLKLISKLKTLSLPDSTIVIDAFNKEWRDSIEPTFYKLLFDNGKTKLEIKRNYDNQTGIETTRYIKTNENGTQKFYDFSQKFFDEKELIEVSSGFPDFDIISSEKLHSRKNSQKKVLILKR